MGKTREFYLDGKYQALRLLIKIQYGFAILMAIGACMAFVNLYELQWVLAVTAIAVAAIIAFLFILNAQMLQLFIDLEWNQRETNGLLVQVIENLPENPAFTKVKSEGEIV